MHKILKTAITPFSDKKMFDLVSDINSYPQFLSWCSDAKIITKNNNEIQAFIAVNKGPFNKKFTTKNILYPNHKITIELINGPFKSMNGEWEFLDLKQKGTKINFKLNFAFNSKVLDLTLSPAFSLIANTQLDAFIKRAKQIYN